jgi:hypothetical protein
MERNQVPALRFEQFKQEILHLRRFSFDHGRRDGAVLYRPAKILRHVWDRKAALALGRTDSFETTDGHRWTRITDAEPTIGIASKAHNLVSQLMSSESRSYPCESVYIRG